MRRSGRTAAELPTPTTRHSQGGQTDDHNAHEQHPCDIVLYTIVRAKQNTGTMDPESRRNPIPAWKRTRATGTTRKRAVSHPSHDGLQAARIFVRCVTQTPLQVASQHTRTGNPTHRSQLPEQQPRVQDPPGGGTHHPLEPAYLTGSRDNGTALVTRAQHVARGAGAGARVRPNQDQHLTTTLPPCNT